MEKADVERIENALARIEAAASARDSSGSGLALRHAALRNRVAGAIDALDDLIARAEAGSE
jgi:hypothetical protein